MSALFGRPGSNPPPAPARRVDNEPMWKWCDRICERLVIVLGLFGIGHLVARIFFGG